MRPLRAPTRPDASSDPDLMLRLQRGDLGALGVLHDRYYADVVSVAAHAGVGRDEADDVAQEVFLKLIELAPRYDGRPSARPWVLGITWRLAVRRRRSLARWLHALGEFIAHVDHASAASPEDAALTREGWAALRAQVDRLPERMRSVFVLVEVEGLSGEEAASALGIPVATVWTRLHYARKKVLAAGGGDR